MRRLRRDASICSSGTDRSFPERTPPGFARRSPRDRRYGAARPAKAIERPRVPQSFFSLAPLAKSRRFPRTPLSAERHARRKTAFSAERDKEFGGVVDDAGTDRRSRKHFPRSPKSARPPPFTLSRLPASTLRAARMLRPESSASFFVGSDVMQRPATSAGTEGSGKTRPRPRSFSSTVTGCFRKRIRRGRVEKRVPLLSPSYGGPVARKTRAAATFAMPEAVTNPIVA